ncbi:N-end rule pathway, recognition component UBR1 [Ceraceosorus bombacis]|uniref:E3 ubiquitin-protein ligase n=1 Tax=Ceraceosorus bombacis TaxID=401625 RepID=A0A0P1BDM0_9BASI|nr:N-end rule pathway, recognition component UBR1 [Ceraceosorus bombacis]
MSYEDISEEDGPRGQGFSFGASRNDHSPLRVAEMDDDFLFIPPSGGSRAQSGQASGSFDTYASAPRTSQGSSAWFIDAHIGGLAEGPEYELTPMCVRALHRSLWSTMFALVPAVYLLPRQLVPTGEHALRLLEESDWNLCETQRRAVKAMAEAARDGKGKGVEGRMSFPLSGQAEFDLGPEYSAERRGMPCGHVFKKGEAIYRCRDCGLDDTCVQCAPCFNASSHEGHDIVFSVSASSGGCCDCGDDEAWKNHLGCKYHESRKSQAEGYAGDESMDEAGPAGSGRMAVDDEFADNEEDDHSTYHSAVEDGGTRLGTSASAKSPMRGSAGASLVDSLIAKVPRDVLEGLTSHLTTLLTYVLDTVEHAPSECKPRPSIAAIERQPDLRNDAEPRVPGGNPPERMYSVVLWNDEKHSFKTVIDTVVDAVDVSENRAKRIAERIDRHGRDVIYSSSDVRRLLVISRKLTAVDLGATISATYDVFAEEVAHHVLSMIFDLANASLYVPSETSDRMFDFSHPLAKLVPNAVAMRAITCKALLERWSPRKPVEQGMMSHDYFDTRDLRKLDALLLLDIRLWKAARALTRKTLMAIIGAREVRREVALRFARVYPKAIENFILKDREPEHSICLMTVQLFSVPSVARELVLRSDVNFFQKLLQMLQSIFTGNLMSARAIELPPLPPLNGVANTTSMLLRQQRCYHIFSDLRYVLLADGVQDLLVSQPPHLEHLLSLLSLFNAITPDRRAIGEHVEFENETWVPIFHISTQLGRVAKLFGEAFHKATPRQLQDALLLAARNLLLNLLTLHQNLPESYEPIVFRPVNFDDEQYEVILFEVDRTPVSFHHPMHALFAELLKHANRAFSNGRSQALRLADIFPSDIDEKSLLNIIDFPLRVVVKLAQIRAGMWVRNGFAIRSQAHHYRDHSMRDVMYDQDLFLIQAGLALISPDRMLVSIIDRFGLLKWMQGDHALDGPIDPDQARFLAEELLLLLITLFSETGIAIGSSMEDQVRREIVHFLALGQGQYSDLTRHISERLCDHSSFDRVLAQVSNFRAPGGTTDLGIFELKDEHFDEVQPYFFHYTRNQREKADEVLRLRHKRKIGGMQEAADNYVALPTRRLAAGQGVVVDALREALNSRVLTRAIFSTLDLYGSADEPEPDQRAIDDTYVEAALQLLLQGVVERGGDFVRNLATLLRAPALRQASTVLGALQNIEKRTSSKPIKAKCTWLIDHAISLDRLTASTALSHDRIARQNVSAKAKAPAEDPKRAAAKARQAAILNQFSAAQKSLLESLDDDDDDEEEEDELDDADDYAQAVGRREEEREPQSLGTCILCQEDLKRQRAFGSLALIQTSRVMRTTPRRQAHALQEVMDVPLSLDRGGSNGRRVSQQDTYPAKENEARRPAQLFNPVEDHRTGFHASTCGHSMHLSCFESYCKSIEQRHTQQIARNHPEVLGRHEFVCPLCKSLGNVLLPLPDASSLSPTPLLQLPISEWLRKINIDILKTSANNTSAELQEGENGTGSFLPWYAENAFTWRVDTTSDSSLDQDTMKMLDRLIVVLRPLSAQTRSARETWSARSITALPGKKMYMPEELVAYTVGMLEVAHRGTSSGSTSPTSETSGSAIGDAILPHTMEVIRSLLHCLSGIARSVPGSAKGSDVTAPLGNKALALMQQGLLKRLLPHWGNDASVASPLLLRDPLTILIETAILAPASLGHVTTLMYYATLVHTIFGIAQPSVWPQNGGGLGRATGFGVRASTVSADELAAIKSIFPDVRWTLANIIGYVGYAWGQITLGVDGLDDASLGKMLCSYTLPFLRRAAILHAALKVPLASTSGSADGPGGSMEYLRLMRAMRIPTPAEAIPPRVERQTALTGIIEGWIKHAYNAMASLFRPLPIHPSPLSLSSASAHLHSSSAHPMVQLEHPAIYELLTLPHDLAALLQDTQRVVCKRCGESPAEPAICLTCGATVCFQSFCCEDEASGRGECNWHLDECGGSMGLFFKVKTNIVLLLYAGNGSFTYSPYLDTHGELDIGLRKGRPQRLHMQRYDELRKQWLNHSVCHFVARKLEASMDNGGWGGM